MSPQRGRDSKDISPLTRSYDSSVDQSIHTDEANQGAETVNAVAVLGEARGETIEQVAHCWLPLGTNQMGAWREQLGSVCAVRQLSVGMEAKRRRANGGGHDPAHHYGARGEVVTFARRRVIDVTPIASSICEAPTFHVVDLVYVNKWSKLEIGGVRYGVMCAEDGVVMDDGVTGRLSEDHYLMTTTSSGAATVWEWIENWLQTEHPEWKVHVTPVTGGYASMNVAGPSSRILLQRLVKGIDLSPNAFPYMNVRQGSVAGVDCFMWRIGFTGELSYEIHVPASYGLHVWEALFESGADLGIGPSDSRHSESCYCRGPSSSA